MFFNWKRIQDPEFYFTEEFGELLNRKVDFHFCEAKAQGLKPPKVVVKVMHFIERAPTNYSSIEVHQARAKAEKSSKEQRDICPVPFGEIFAVLGSNADDSECQFLLTGTTQVPGGVRLN